MLCTNAAVSGLSWSCMLTSWQDVADAKALLCFADTGGDVRLDEAHASGAG